MAEMEKEGRPPESKRSRKPAHPVKREINEEMKSFAENTMNELLGWYGYDKVELRDAADGLDIGETPQHISVLKENLLPRTLAPAEGGNGSPDRANGSQAPAASRNGVAEPASTPSTSTPGAKEHGGLPLVAPMIPPPLIKPPADEDAGSMQIMCAWCQKVGVKRYSLTMGSELKSFCSEKCFAACRRAYFKRNKVCDWCKHIRHTKEYLDFGAGERRLQFCSAKCLNQYKMDIFYKETQAALPGIPCTAGHGGSGEGKGECSGGIQLLTPESWGAPLTDLRRKAPSPAGPPSASALAPCTSSATSPCDAVCSPSSASSAKIPTPRPHESPTLPPPPIPALHPAVGVPPGSPPMVMTPRGPMPLPLFMEHQMMQQIRPPFLRPSNHPGGPNSPLSNPIIPGIGPPPPPRTLGPPSSPMHRPLMSPHVHPSSNPAHGMMPAHPGLPLPGLPPFPPVNMMPNGPLPLPPMMNFGLPSLAPLVPPPTLLVPYPVIVPLPVPIPIPIPIPFSPKTPRDQAENSGSARGAPESSEDPGSGPRTSSPSGGDGGERRAGPAGGERLSPGCSERSKPALVDLTVKAEEPCETPCAGCGGGGGGGGAGQMDGVIDLTVGQRSCQQQVIHRAVKVEPDAESRTPLDVVGKVGRDAGEHHPAGKGASAHRSWEASAPPPADGKADISRHPVQNPARTQPRPASEPPAPCNVIVNGTGWHPLHLPTFESRPDRRGDGAAEGADEPPANGELERDSLKENNCSMGERDSGRRGSTQDPAAGAAEGKPDPDSNLEEGEHAYALPLLSSGGCVVIQPVPKPGADKTAILSCSISAPLSAAGSPELEPPLKRRCLRIRNQNK